jgi:hypothetical protein
VVFTDSSDVGTTGVATLTLTPSIGVTNLPALVQGDPGLPPTLRNITVNQVAAGTTPPASTWTLVTPGSPGVASVYDLTLYVNQGADGISGSFTFSSATDLKDPLNDKYIPVYSSADGFWHNTPQRIVGIYEPSSFQNYAGNDAQATLAAFTIPKLPFDWRPVILGGFACPAGTANTHIDLTVNLTSTTGDQFGYGPGTTGLNVPPVPVQTVYGDSITAGTGAYAKVSAGSAANILFVARQTANTTDAWSVPNTPGRIGLTVGVVPLP